MAAIDLPRGEMPRAAAVHRLSFRWYLSRLRSMSLAEVAWRARSAAGMPIDWIHSQCKPSVPPPDWKPLDAASYPVKIFSSASPVEKIHLFDLQFPLGFEFDWHHDYRTGKQVEQRFAGMLNIRDTAVVGDLKYLWEPSRHQHLSTLAFGSNADEHVGYIVRSLESWLEANRYLCGVHWTSSLEVAERIISWAMLYPRIAEHVACDEQFRNRWLSAIYLHLRHIAKNLSLHSSANNHLIGELAGLFIGASCFGFWAETARWKNLAHKLLEREIFAQIGEDGVNREQAMSYHLFTLELFLLAFIVGRKTNTPFSPRFAQRLQSMASFVDAVATDRGDLPWYGDSDDARGFLLAPGESVLDVTMQLAALVFDEPSWLRLRKTPTTAAHVLVPDLAGKFAPDVERSAKRRELFLDAGFACVRAYDESIRLVMDFGPLGFQSTAAHGHADALSIWLAIDDEYFLVDAGTYAYHLHPEWRNYFRSTAAHNTARIDGRNQSEMAGRFLWSEKTKAHLLKFEEQSANVLIDAEHDGYTRLPDPVIHRRSVRFCRTTADISIDDRFECGGRHEIELFFHLHEDTAVLSVRDGEAEVSWRKRHIVFSSPDPNAHWEIVSGSIDPKLGWRSRQFNRKEAIPTLRVLKKIDGSTNIRTHIAVTA